MTEATAPGQPSTPVPANGLPPGMLAIPAVDFMPTRCAAALAWLMRTLPRGSVVSFDTSPWPIGAKRNKLVEEFLANPALQWLLQIDSDMLPPRHTPAQLAGRNRDIIGASYFCRHLLTYDAGLLDPLYDPAELLANWNDRDPVPFICMDPWSDGPPVRAVDFVGTGCLFVRRHVFEAMGGGWFDDPSGRGRGEDYAFCLRAKLAGFQPHTDTALFCGHLGMQNIDENFARAIYAAGLVRAPRAP